MEIHFPIADFKRNQSVETCQQKRIRNSHFSSRDVDRHVAVTENIFRLADAVKKTQKRANALSNILIPQFEATVKFITEALDEKEREDFTRLKVVKSVKMRAQANAETPADEAQ